MPTEPTEPQTPETQVDDSAETSLSEHEAQFYAKPGEASASQQPAEPAEPSEPAEPKATVTRAADGKFTKAEPSKRAAKSAAQERIDELTRQWRQAERERDEWKAKAATPAVPQPAPAPAPERPAVAATVGGAPRPTEEDTNPDGTPKWKTYGEYVDAFTDWKIEQREIAAQQRETERRERERITTSWTTRESAIKTEFPDFEQVAYHAPHLNKVPKGSIVDGWILEHPHGLRVLYHLGQNEADLDTILAMRQPDGKPDVFRQVDALSLLSQRLSPATREPAAGTGAAATTPRSSGPRPPTPVRTGPMRAETGPPGEDASLADHEKFYYPQRRHA